MIPTPVAARASTLLALGLAVGCGFPSQAPTTFELSAAWGARLAQEPALEALALDALTELFGSPAEPRLHALEAWVSAGLDPNRPDVAVGHGGSGELDAVERERIRAGNRARFERELESIERGEYAGIGPWDGAPTLSSDWAALVAEHGDDDGFRGRARAFLLDHYPALRDSAALYQARCLTCHGNEGGGDGPGARFLRPRPRDFRLGVFKFTAVADHGRPRRADLVRVLAEGIQGTSMPSFGHHSPAELHGLADYVRLLAMRGETERWLIDDLESGDELGRGDALEAYVAVFEAWRAAEQQEVPLGSGPPPATPELLARGRRLYLDEGKGNCASCHGTEGRGDGPAVMARDGGVAFRDAWGDEIRPRDLTRGLRYGDAPADVYRRIHAGINGTPMPGIGGVVDGNGEPLLSERELWAIVHYVRGLAGLAPEGTR